MKSSKLFLAAAVLLAATVSSFAIEPLVAVESAADHNSLVWVNQYYKNPNPEILMKRAYVLSSMGYFEEEGQPAQAIGFFAAVFAQNPERVNFWLSQMSGLPAKHQRLLVAAAWQSGHALTAAQQQILNASDDTAVAAFLTQKPVSLGETAVLSTSSMNLQWGAFLATGNERHVTNILAAVGSKIPEINTSARISLALNAAQDDRVLEICRRELDKQPNDVREMLRAAINEAQNSKSPNRS